MSQTGSQSSSNSAPSKRSNGAQSTGAASHRIAAPSVSEEAIARRAYQKFIARGSSHGSAEEDWAAAERELIAEARGE
jgi:hypothetical protein